MIHPIHIFIVVQFVLFLFYQNCYLKIENFQYTEMIFASLFIILIFGFGGEYMLSIPNILYKSIYFASLFSIWYYFTKFVTNSFMKDKNGVIHWSI